MYSFSILCCTLIFNNNFSQLFYQARLSAPSIIFLDEIDCLVSQRKLDKKSQGIGEKVLSALLNEMDGFGNIHFVFFFKFVCIIMYFKFYLHNKLEKGCFSFYILMLYADIDMHYFYT